MLSKARLLLWILLLLVLAGCGSGGSATGTVVSATGGGAGEPGIVPGGPPPAPPSGRSVANPNPGRTVAKEQSQAFSTTVNLAAGWNPVAFESAQLTALSANPLIPGLAWYDGNIYQFAEFTQEDINSAAGGRRGFYAFATAPTSFSYAGPPDTQGAVSLHNGWNLVSFTNSDPIAGANLTTRSAGQPVPIQSVLFRSFYELQPNGSHVVINTANGGVLTGGRPYWVYALGNNVSLHWAAPAPSSLRLISVPASVSADSASNASLQFTVTAEVLDQFGQRFPGSQNVTLETAPPGALGGNVTVAAAAGLATFPGLSLATAGNVGLAATAAGLTNSTTNTVVVTPGQPVELAFTTQPSDATAGQPLSPPVELAFHDAQDNVVVPAPPVNVTLQSGANDPTLGGKVSATDAVTGRATFASLQQTTVGQDYQLTGSGTLAGNLITSAPSQPFDVVAATGSSLTITPSQTSVQAGGNVDMLIELRDQFGNLAAGNLTLSINSAPGQPVPDLRTDLPGVQSTLEASTSNGLHFFSIQPNAAGSWVLEVASPGASSQLSGPVTVTPGSLSTLQFDNGPFEAFFGFDAPFIDVVARDVFGNALTSGSVTINHSGFAAGTLTGNQTTIGAVVPGKARFTTLRHTQPLTASYTSNLYAYMGPLTAVSTMLFKGWEFPVNTQTSGDQYSDYGHHIRITPRNTVAMDAEGNFVVVWTSAHTGPRNVYARLFTAKGVPLGDEFQVNTGGNPCLMPCVARSPVDGSFVVGWSAGADVHIRRFHSAGSPLTGALQVNTGALDGNRNEWNPSIGMNPTDGSFVVAWEQDEDGVGFYRVMCRRYSAAASALGNEMHASSLGPPLAGIPSVAVRSDGAFAVACAHLGSRAPCFTRFDANGVMMGGTIEIVDSYPTWCHTSVAFQPGTGHLVLGWASGAYARVHRFNFATGAQVDQQLLSGLDQTNGGASVAVASDGRILLATGKDPAHFQVCRFAAALTAGPEQTTTWWGDCPSVACGPDGTSVVAFLIGDGTPQNDGSGRGIRAIRQSVDLTQPGP